MVSGNYLCGTTYNYSDVRFKKTLGFSKTYLPLLPYRRRLALKGGTLERGTLERWNVERGTLERGTLERGTLFFTFSCYLSIF
jgi:hypothetical protein